jgi:hypothetical protein
MTDLQATMSSDAEREHYAANVLKKKKGQVAGKRWYADNTREPIRDETLRDGLMTVGAVHQRQDLPTTSSAPRYFLKTDFAALFDPSLKGIALESAIQNFKQRISVRARWRESQSFAPVQLRAPLPLK